MDSRMRLIALCIASLMVSGAVQAQSTVTTNGGTTNAIPRFSGTATLVNSAITESNGYVGIGSVNIGTGNSGNGVYLRTPSDGQQNIGIGTTSPGAKLDMAGDVKLSGTGASIIFPDGTPQNMPWTGMLCGGDYAESVDVSGDGKRYEPGDVLVLSGDDASDVAKSSQPYSTLVSGIYSTKPGVLGRRQTGEKSDTEIPMAMVGVVPTKVSAENGPIRKGDLLVTSSTEGHAMKGTDRSLLVGAIVGKALGSLNSGIGVIEVLVSLQ